MKQKELIPQRRFKGFIEKWRKKTLGEILDLLKDGTHGTHQNVRSGIYLLSAKNIKNGRVNFDKSDRKISMEEYRTIHRNFDLKKGDVLLTVVGSIGESAILKQPSKFTFQRSVAYLRPTEEITSQFLYTIINSINFQKELFNRQIVSAQPGIYLGDLSVIPVYFPALEEQQKIGQFFKHLDEMIALRQRKIDKTKALKSAYLAEMFPAEGERIPKRRFAGYMDEWETKKLGNIGQTFTGLSGKTKEDFGRGNAEFITYLNVFNNPISNVNITENVEVDKKQDEVKYGDVLFTTSSETPHEVGMSSVWLGNRPNIYLNSFCFGYRINISINYLFIAYLFRSNMIRKQMQVLAQGISRYNISKNKVMDLEILLPIKSEQKKIGEFFKHIDDIITTQEQKLEKLKATKQAYLHEMFV